MSYKYGRRVMGTLLRPHHHFNKEKTYSFRGNLGLFTGLLFCLGMPVSSFAEPAVDIETKVQVASAIAPSTLAPTTIAPSTDVKSDSQSLEDATQRFKTLLENAKINGFVSSKEEVPKRDEEGPETNAQDDGHNGKAWSRSKAAQKTALKDKKASAEYSCEDVSVLNMEPYWEVENFEDLISEKFKANGSLDPDEVEGLALTYISLGMGAEAKTLLRPYKMPRHVILSRVSDLISGHKFSPSESLLGDVSECSAAADLWASYENPARLEYRAFLAGPKSLRNELKTYPKFLQQYLTTELSILADENGNPALSKFLWTDLRTTNPRLNSDLGGDHALMYLKATQLKDTEPEMTQAIFKYLSERDGLFRARALGAFNDYKMKNSAEFDENLNIDLEAIHHEYSGEKAGRDAAVQLIKNRIEAGMAIDAIRSTKKMLNPEDEEFLYAVDLIAVHIQGLFNSPDSAVNMLGLNSYLEDPEIFDVSSHRLTLQRAALLAAIALDLPELGDLIYRAVDTKNDSDQAFVAYARALSALKRDEFPSDAIDLASDVANHMEDAAHSNGLRLNIIKTAFRLGDFKTARLTIETLPDEDEKSDYKTKLAWLEQEWGTVRTNLAQDETAQTASDKSRLNMVNLILDNSPMNKTKKSKRLNTPMDIAAYISDLDSDLTTVQEYLDNG